MHVKEPIQLCGLLWCGAKVYLCKLALRAACKTGNCGLKFAHIFGPFELLSNLHIVFSESIAKTGSAVYF